MSAKFLKHLIQSSALACMILAPFSVFAQSPFEKVAQVNGSIITQFELDQRILFLQLLGSPASSNSDVLDELIKDRLRQQITKKFDVFLSEEALQQGLTDFAARAELSSEDFIQQLKVDGVARQTFRDFVTVSLVWRDYIRARYGNSIDITDDQVDRAVQSVSSNTGIDVLVSEIIIPTSPDIASEVLEVAEEIMSSNSTTEFSEYATRYSATASREDGGRLDWVPLTDLPPQLRPILLSLAPGEITNPLPIPDAIALFQLRDIRERSVPAIRYSSIDYAVYLIGGGRSSEALRRAQKVKASIDRCDDLYGVAQNEPQANLKRENLSQSKIPRDIALELSKLDKNEVSTALTRSNGSTLVFLMLCGRTPALSQSEDDKATREAVAAQLLNTRLSALSNTLLDELQADADIVIFN
ncbi:peptidylprolyl isomerase [Tateyamaria sp.]|nr:peptidylprolyl isomerase [Tateyamaria sp.]